MSRLWQREIEEILATLDDLPPRTRPRILRGGIRHLLRRDTAGMNDAANRNRLGELDPGTTLIDGQAASMAAPLPGLQLGFRWGAGDWALLALWSAITSALTAYVVIIATIW